MFKPSADDIRAARAAATPAAGGALGYNRLGFLYFSTGRLCSGPACDPFAEGTFGTSDISRAGDGVAFYFSFTKALAWIFAIASIFAIPQAAMNAGGALQGAWGLAALSQTMLGNLGASGANGITASGMLGARTAAVLSAVGSARVPGLYAALDFCAIFVVSAGVLWMLRFLAARKNASARDALGAEDYTIMVSGLQRGVLSACAAGDCTCGSTALAPEALVAHFEAIARTFTSDWRVARVAASGRPEVFFAGAELRAAPLFGKRAELMKTLRARQSELMALEKRVGVEIGSRWTRKSPGFSSIAEELKQLVGTRVRAAKVARDLATLEAESIAEAQREAAHVASSKRSGFNAGIYADDDGGVENSYYGDGSGGKTRNGPREDGQGRPARADSVLTAELLDSPGDETLAAAAGVGAIAGAAVSPSVSMSSPQSRMTAPDRRRARQRALRDGIPFVEGDAAAASPDGDNDNSSVATVPEPKSLATSSSQLAASRAPTAGGQSLLFGGRGRHASPHTGEEGPLVLTNVSSTSRALAGARYSDDESSGSLTSVEQEKTGGKSRRGAHRGSGSESDTSFSRTDSGSDSSGATNRSRDSDNSRGKNVQRPRAQRPTGDAVWWPAWMGGGGDGGGASADGRPKLERVPSARSRPPSAHAESSGRFAAAPADGPFSNAVHSHVSKKRARELAAQLEAARSDRNRSKKSSSRMLSQLTQRPTIGLSLSAPERLTVKNYARKSSIPCWGLCGDRPPLDVLDVPLGSVLSRNRAKALAVRVAWLRGRIDDLLWDIDAATREATRFIPDSDVIAELGGDAARRAAADAAAATSPGAVRDAARAKEAAGEDYLGSPSNKTATRDVATEDPIVAFITFESAQTAAALIRIFAMGGLEWCIRGGTANVAPPVPGGRPKWFAPDSEAATIANASAKKIGGAAIISGHGARARDGKRGSAMDDDDDAESGYGGEKESKDDAEETAPVELTFWGLKLRVEPAPPADTLLWENLHTHAAVRAARNCSVSLLAATLCLLSFALLYGSQVLQSSSSLLANGSASFCAIAGPAEWASIARADVMPSSATPPYSPQMGGEYFSINISAAIAGGVINSSIQEQTGLLSVSNDLLIASAVLKNFRLPTPTSPEKMNTNYYWNLSNNDCGVAAAKANDLRGTPLPFSNATKLTCGLLPNDINSTMYTFLQIWLPATEAARSCKCSLAFVRAPGSLIPPGLTDSMMPSAILGAAARWALALPPGSDPRVQPDWVTCFPWVLAYVSYAGIVCAASLSVILVNSIMTCLLNALKRCEAHTTTDRARAAHLIRAVILQCFNTALLVLLVSAYIPSLPVDTPGAKYSDFSNSWYTNKGPTLVIAIIALGLTPPLVRCLSASYSSVLACFMKLGFCISKVQTSADLSALLSPPVFDYAERYAEIITLVSVTLVYSTGIPLLIPLTALFLGFGGVIDRALFMTHFTAPPIEDASTGHVAVALIPFSLLLHALVGAWMMSTPGLSAMASGVAPPSSDASISVSTPEPQSPSEFALQIAQRASQVWVAPLLLEAALWATWLLLAGLAIYCFRPISSAAGGLWRACACARRGTHEERSDQSPPAGAAEGPRELAATDIRRAGDFEFLSPVLKWLPRVSVMRDARGEATPAVIGILEASLAAQAAAEAEIIAVSSTTGAGKDAALSPVGSVSPRRGETKAARAARRAAEAAAVEAARAAAEDAAAERAARRAVCVSCIVQSCLCICTAVRDAGIWIIYACCQRPKARRAAAALEAAMEKRLASAARRERRRARDAARAAKGKPPKHSNADLSDDDDAELPIVIEDEPPPPCHVYCCGGRVRACGPCCPGGVFGCCRAAMGAPPTLPPGSYTEDSRSALLAPPPFASALSLRLLRGSVSYSPLANAPLVRSTLPELWLTRAHLPARHVTLARAAVFGYAEVMPKGNPGRSEPAGYSEDIESWEESENACWEGVPDAPSPRWRARGRAPSAHSDSSDESSNDDPSPTPSPVPPRASKSRSPRSPRVQLEL